MGLFEIGIAVVLFLFLVVMTLMINPPEKWVQKLTNTQDKDKPKL
ncbi:MAG: hypothetical protein SGI92_21000 [Bryobacteraceae bacterium]|nr:hypothetical protein [Bryobacteraceae bacterium]